MGKRACALMAGSVFLLAAATPAWAKDGIFSRFQRTLHRDSTKESTQREAQASTAAAASTIVDAWSNDPILRMAQRALDGDHNGVLLDMFDNPNMAKVWQDPKISRHLLNGMPMLKTFNGMEQFMGKDTLTPDDGLKAFELLRSYVTVFPTKMEGVLNSDKMADKIRDYANTEDEGLKSLYRLVEKGDFNALKQLNKNIADKEWGGMLNLDVLGMDGKEPESTQILRKSMMSQEPDLFRLVHQDDDYIKGYIVDPTKAYREAMANAGLAA